LTDIPSRYTIRYITRGADMDRLIQAWIEQTKINQSTYPGTARWGDVEWAEAAIQFSAEWATSHMNMNEADADAWADNPEVYAQLLDASYTLRMDRELT
jgi:hypothetical protein